MFFLCVDDSATLRKILTLTLQGAGHSCAEAENGQLALEFLASATNQPDCVILDVFMPTMSGVDFLRARQAQPRLAAIPVIMLTTEASQDLISTVRELGADGFLSKPFRKEDLLNAVNRVTGH